MEESVTPTSMNAKELASHIDHTLLKPDAVASDIQRLCAEACEFHFFGVCIHGSWVSFARNILSGTDIRIISVAGFPLGAASTYAKCFETAEALNNGASEIDVVLNIGRLKQKDDGYVESELSEILRIASGRPVKVIIETCLLTREEKIRACLLVANSGAAFVKTSTGFGPGGATVADVELLRQYAGPGTAVKASGGIRDFRTALAMLNAGASRLGTSSSVAIIETTIIPKENA